MGRDKATLDVEGAPLARRSQRALLDAQRVTYVGGDHHPDPQGDRPTEWRRDAHPGGGPLPAIKLCLDTADSAVVAILACDLPGIDAAAVRTLVERLTRSGADVAVPIVGGRSQWLAAAWRTSPARAGVAAALDVGSRAPRQAMRWLSAEYVIFADDGTLDDVDSVEDLARSGLRYRLDDLGQ